MNSVLSRPPPSTMAPCSDAEDGSEVTGEDESTLGSVRYARFR
jgi:hypothetical protein